MFKFNIKGTIFQINNKVKQFDNRIKELVSTFNTENIDGDAKFLMDINLKSIKINLLHKTIKLNIKTTFRDLYQIFYFFVYLSMQDKNKAFIHSAIASKNDKAILVLGDFGAGKTTLCLELEKYGFEINSSDHALIELVNHNLTFTYGTKRLKHNNITKYLNISAIEKQIKIYGIYILIGMSNKGDTVLTEITDKVRKVKKLWKYFTWAYTTPLENYTNEPMYQLNCDLINFCREISKLQLKIFECRGSSDQLANQININSEF